jgi:hypothetical protein
VVDAGRARHPWPVTSFLPHVSSIARPAWPLDLHGLPVFNTHGGAHPVYQINVETMLTGVFRSIN